MTAPTVLLQHRDNNKLGPWKRIFEGQEEVGDFGRDTASTDEQDFASTTSHTPTASTEHRPIDMHDENDFPLKQETTKAQEQSPEGTPMMSNTFFRDPNKYEPYLEGLMKSLSNRESALGRYNHVTALTYASLGNAYRNLQEPRAVAMYRAQFRIQIILYGKTNGNIIGPLREVLLLRGLTSSQIGGIQKDLFLSTRYEMEGDWFRRYGRRHQAFWQYHSAARLEELSFGRDNPDLAYLWRKMACLAAIKKDSSSDENESSALIVDWDDADRLGNEWLRQARKVLSSGVCSLIRKGDHFFGMLLFSHAVGAYYKASSIMLTVAAQHPSGVGNQLNSIHSKQKKSKSNKSRRPQHNASKLVQDTPQKPDLTNELETFLKQETPAPRINVPSDSLSFSIHSLIDQDDDEPRSTTNTPRGSRKYAIQEAPSPQFDLSRDTLQDDHQDDNTVQTEVQSKKPISSSSFVSTLSEVSRPIPPKPKETQSTSSSKTITSRSTFIRRAPRSTESTKSLPSLRRSSTRTIETRDDEQETKKPKSDSYLSKIASRTRKAASKAASKTTKMAKRQIKKGAHTLRDISKASLDGSSRRSWNRSIPVTTTTDDPPPSKPRSISSTSRSKKESSSYNIMASPPMTPFPKTLKSSGSQFDDIFSTLDPPSEPQAESIDNSILVGGAIPPPPPPGDESGGGPLNQFFLSRQASANQTFMGHDVLMSILSSPNAKTKTSDETLPVDNRTTTTDVPNTTTSPPSSLDELLSRIQSMTATLQRKTVRLQHRLNLDKGSWMSSSSASNSTSGGKFMPKGSKDLYGDIERLFEDCEKQLQQAFDKIASLYQDGANHQDRSKSLALEEYQKTFALEQSVLTELRRKFHKLVVSPAVVSVVETKKEK